jgi:hypothetical protein
MNQLMLCLFYNINIDGSITLSLLNQVVILSSFCHTTDYVLISYIKQYRVTFGFQNMVFRHMVFAISGSVILPGFILIA